MDDFVSMHKLPFRSIDPRVQERLLLSQTNSVGRTMLAAALCPEILSDRKRWEAPKSFAVAERLGEQCGRTPTQIRVAMLEWLTTPQKNLEHFPLRMRALWKWDPILAAWIMLRFSSELVPMMEDFLREPFEEAITSLRRSVDLAQKKKTVSAGSVADEVLQGFSPYGEFAESLFDNTDTRGEAKSSWRVALALRKSIYEMAFALSNLDDLDDSDSENAGIGLAARTLPVTLWEEHTILQLARGEIERDVTSRRVTQIVQAERSSVVLRLLERAVYEYPYGYRQTSSSGEAGGRNASFARGAAMVAVGAAAGAVAFRFIPRTTAAAPITSASRGLR